MQVMQIDPEVQNHDVAWEGAEPKTFFCTKVFPTTAANHSTELKHPR